MRHTACRICYKSLNPCRLVGKRVLQQINVEWYAPCPCLQAVVRVCLHDACNVWAQHLIMSQTAMLTKLMRLCHRGLEVGHDAPTQNTNAPVCQRNFSAAPRPHAAQGRTRLQTAPVSTPRVLLTQTRPGGGRQMTTLDRAQGALSTGDSGV